MPLAFFLGALYLAVLVFSTVVALPPLPAEADTLTVMTLPLVVRVTLVVPAAMPVRNGAVTLVPSWSKAFVAKLTML